MYEIAHPEVGFGTYKLQGMVCLQAIASAMKSGYRVFDTATYYKNFQELGSAFKPYDRGHFYLISKVWHDMQSPQNLRKDLEETLRALQFEYIDAYLLHWPNSQMSIQATLQTMESLQKEGKVRHLGLSNVSANHLQKALEVGVPISWVQIEMHPHFYDAQLTELCKQTGVKIQAWAPLRRGKLIQDDALVKIGAKYQKTSAQVALRWILHHGAIPLPCSRQEAHIRENREVEDFQLSLEEIEQINAYAKSGQRERFNIPRVGFMDEFDLSYEKCWPSIIEMESAARQQ